MRYILRLKGKAKHVFAMLNILATTEPIEQDKDWWTLRAYLIAHDQDRSSPGQLKLRSN